MYLVSWSFFNTYIGIIIITTVFAAKLMERKQLKCKLYFEDLLSNRKKLFQDALNNARAGRVLYIMCNELEELPQVSQELNPINRQYMKMISFLYAQSLPSLVETLASLPEWQNVPKTIILDDISTYCKQSCLHAACGLVALLTDSARSCSESLKEPCYLFVSASKGVVDETYCSILRELYLDCYSNE